MSKCLSQNVDGLSQIFSSFSLTNQAGSSTVVGMEQTGVEQDVDELLRSIQDGLKKAEEVLSSMLEGMVSDSAILLTELESALTDAEAAVLSE